ncbi:unnamed protein product [Coffea canephora]|uniref:Uncharacterized protein n=1 Tax=Coffea canephora TaxID=49390 RepID=A0A068V725_COFCA|nr:unnamed protein product [Coffea canephora]
MKRNHPKLQQPSAAAARVQVQESSYSGGGGSSTGSGSYYSTMASCNSAGGGSQSKGKMWVDESDRQDDELLAVWAIKSRQQIWLKLHKRLSNLKRFLVMLKMIVYPIWFSRPFIIIPQIFHPSLDL